MQERRVNMRGGRPRPSVREPFPVDDSAYWSAQEPVSVPSTRTASADAVPSSSETYVERVWNLAVRTVSDLLHLNPTEPPQRQRRTETDGEGVRTDVRDSPRRFHDDSFARPDVDTAASYTRPSVAAQPIAGDMPANTTTAAPTAPASSAPAAPASNITVYQFYSAPPSPGFYPPVPGQTVPNGRLSTGPDLFVPRVSLLSRPVMTYAGQKRLRTQDRPLNPLVAPSLTIPPPTPHSRDTARTPVAQPTSATPGKPTFSLTPKPAETAVSVGTKPSLDVSATLPNSRGAAPTTTMPAANAKPSTNSFFNTGPPAEVPPEDGFASNADSGDDEDSTSKAKADAPKPVFTFGAPAPSSAPAASPALANPFSSSSSSAPMKPTFTAAPSTTPAAATKPSTNSFFNTGPPAEVPPEDGFASNADSGDDEDSTSKAKADAPKPVFTFGAPAAPATPSAPSNPFSFGSSTAPVKPAFTAAPSTTPAAATKPSTNSFFNTGPPAEIPTEDGFASNADSGDDEDSTSKAKADAPKPVFTFGAPAAPATPSAPSNPFSFGSSTAPVKPAFGAAPSTTPAAAAKPSTNSFFNTGPPAEIPTEDGFASNADSGDDEGESKNTPGKAATPPAPAFSFGLTPSGTGSAESTASRPTQPFGFGASTSSTSVKPAFGSSTGAPTWGSFNNASQTGENKDAAAKPVFSFGVSSSTNVKPAFS